MREFLVFPMVVRVLRLKMRVNSAFSTGRVQEAKAGCWILAQGLLGARFVPPGSMLPSRLEMAHAISPKTNL